MMNQENIGKFITTLRKEKKLTQEQFAQTIGVSNRSVSRWETGRCMPDLSLLQIISKELNVSISELLNGRRMSAEEFVDLRDSINTILDLSDKEKTVKKKKLNKYFLAGMFCLFLILLNHQFEILSFVFKDYIADFVAGGVTGLGLLFEILGLYNNNHVASLKERKMKYFRSDHHSGT